MKKILLPLMAVLLLLSCNRNVLQQKLYLRGRLLLVDTITQYSVNVPVTGQTIKLNNSLTDTLNYTYSTITDSAGYFNFSLIDDGTTQFTVRYDGLIGGYYYTAMDTVNKGDENILLHARLDQSIENGYSMRTLDNVALPQPLPGVTVRVYNNQDLAAIDDPAGAIQVLQSDSSGKFFKFNIPAGSYYFNCTKTLNSAVWQRLLKQVTIGSTGILSDTIILAKSSFQNKLIVAVMDSTQGIIPGAQVYVYNSQVLSASNDPAGAILVSATDNNGIFTAIGLTPGDYYVNATKKVNTTTYQSLSNKFTVATNGTTTGTIILYHSK